MHYFKAHAYRVTPATPGAKVCLSVDGEAYPFGAFQVEVHPGVARILSPEGRYMPVFTLPAPANTA
jgi:sphingosine kinase